MPVVLYECVPAINSLAPPRHKQQHRYLRRNHVIAGRRWRPTAQTIMLLVPSVEVTKGDPHPFWPRSHVLVMTGGLVGVMRKVASLLPPPAKATYVPWLVR